MKGKKINARNFSGVGLVVTSIFGMLGTLSSQPGCLSRQARTQAQQYAAVPKIGYIRNVSGPTSVDQAFRRELLALGYVRDHNIFIAERFAGRDPKTLKKSVDELLNEKVKVIVTLDPPSTRELLRPEHKTADRGIPMVIRIDAEYNYKKPGKNITGMVEISNTPELFGKRLQLLKEVAPQLSDLFLIYNSATPPNALERFGKDGYVTKTLNKAKPADLKIESFDFKDIGLIDPFFKTNLTNARPPYSNGLLVVRNAFILENKETIFKLAEKYKAPAMYTDREFVEAGGLMSYGTDEADLFRQAAMYVDRILKGAKPESIPMRQAIRFELSINLLTAKQMGLEIPPTTLMLADKVVK